MGVSCVIKGIKKQIIEVNEINHPYYERAFLIVKPEYCDCKERYLKKAARKLVKNFGTPSILKKRTNIFDLVLKLGIAAGIGAGLTALVMM